MSEPKFKHVTSLPGHGVELANVVRENEIRRRLSEGDPVQTAFVRMDENVEEKNEEGIPTEAITVSKVVVPPVAKRQEMSPMEAFTEIIKSQSQNTMVEVTGNFGRIQLRAVHISVNDYGLAMIISKDHMSYEPNINTELKVKIGDNEYPVVYAGGFFTFKNIPFNFLSFIKITQ